jgi:hypothetical protein
LPAFILCETAFVVVFFLFWWLSAFFHSSIAFLCFSTACLCLSSAFWCFSAALLCLSSLLGWCCLPRDCHDRYRSDQVVATRAAETVMLKPACTHHPHSEGLANGAAHCGQCVPEAQCPAAGDLLRSVCHLGRPPKTVSSRTHTQICGMSAWQCLLWKPLWPVTAIRTPILCGCSPPRSVGSAGGTQ